ncbi:uncharacterized protein LOC121814320 [Haplochromis burtoni]|uniref:uncharacterized protein LOC121814320 n=1 Tax=Haplochromis burtoni TaxID=8153 RepID=UPI001C2DD35E|nr:uncharacterized protein LOC121814320 [Haplochromis burtoni]
MWRSVFSRTNSSDTDGFEVLDRYYLEPDGFFLPISISRDEQSEVPKTSVSVNAYENEQATTSEIDEAPKTSINNFEHEESPTSENYSTDLFNGVLPKPSDMNKSEENEQNADQGSFQREEKETFFSRVQTNLSALSSIITAPVESVGRGVIFVTRHIFNIGRAPFTSPTSETEKSPTSETTEVPSPSVSVNNFEYEQSPSSETTKIPTTSVNMNNAEDEKSSASESYNTDLLNAILPEPSDKGPEDNEQTGSLQTKEEETISSRVQTNAPNLDSSCRVPDVPVGLREDFITRHLLNIGRTPFTSIIPNLYSSCRVPDVPVGLREAFISRHLLNIGRAPFTSVTTPTSETSETAQVPKTTVSINNFGHEDSPTSESYSIDLFNVGLPAASDNRSEENEPNIVQGTLQREDGDSAVSRLHRNLPGFNSLITAPVVLAGQGVIFVTRHILNICGAPFTSLFNHFSAIIQRRFPHGANSGLIPTIRRWLDIISWMTSVIGALALLVLLIIVIMVIH